MKPTVFLMAAALFLTPTMQTQAQPPYEEGNPGSGGTIEDTVEENTPPGSSSPLDPHPDALNTSTCDYHGTASPYNATYADFASSLTGPKGSTGLTIQNQVEYHHVGGASVVIIEDGNITQHHWYGCRDRATASRTTANTIYQTASLSKFVSSIGLVLAARNGVVDLNRSAQSYADSHPDSLLAEWVDEKFTSGAASYPQSITLRRLLSHTAGLDTHSIGSWEPGNVPTMRDVIMGSNGFDGQFDGGVEPIFVPKTKIEYSGGGYIVAEHILELESPLSFKEYLRQNVLNAANLSLSTFDKAQTSMTNLARPFSRMPASSDVLQTNVKAAGGLLANAREYAELVTALVNGGLTDSGHRVMVQSDIDTILTPAWHSRSSMKSCSSPGAQAQVTGATTWTETCVAGKYRDVLVDSDNGKWRGLGVKFPTTIESDGYPRIVEHSGAQTGARTYFEIDRRTGDGIVIMINGDEEWVDGDGYTYGAEPLLWEIVAAYNATY
jgi:CubicO group peptidase (beta-lactamase class C family)